MEELQDAIEDAQYMSAMHDEMPRPTKEWKWPAADELQTYLDKLKTVNPKIFTPEGFCKGSLGFYLVRECLISQYSLLSYLIHLSLLFVFMKFQFMKFCREQGGIMKVMADFVEDVASFRVRNHILIPMESA